MASHQELDDARFARLIEAAIKSFAAEFDKRFGPDAPPHPTDAKPLVVDAVPATRIHLAVAAPDATPFFIEEPVYDHYDDEPEEVVFEFCEDVLAPAPVTAGEDMPTPVLIVPDAEIHPDAVPAAQRIHLDAEPLRRVTATAGVDLGTSAPVYTTAATAPIHRDAARRRSRCFRLRRRRPPPRHWLRRRRRQRRATEGAEALLLPRCCTPPPTALLHPSSAMPRGSNASTHTDCSMKCPGRAIDVVAPATMCAFTKDLVVNYGHAATIPASTTSVSYDNTNSDLAAAAPLHMTSMSIFDEESGAAGSLSAQLQASSQSTVDTECGLNTTSAAATAVVIDIFSASFVLFDKSETVKASTIHLFNPTCGARVAAEVTHNMLAMGSVNSYTCSLCWVYARGVVLSIPPWPPPEFKMVELRFGVHNLHGWSVSMLLVMCLCWEFCECKKHELELLEAIAQMHSCNLREEIHWFWSTHCALSVLVTCEFSYGWVIVADAFAYPTCKFGFYLFLRKYYSFSHEQGSADGAIAKTSAATQSSHGSAGVHVLWNPGGAEWLRKAGLLSGIDHMIRESCSRGVMAPDLYRIWKPPWPFLSPQQKRGGALWDNSVKEGSFTIRNVGSRMIEDPCNPLQQMIVLRQWLSYLYEGKEHYSWSPLSACLMAVTLDCMIYLAIRIVTTLGSSSHVRSCACSSSRENALVKLLNCGTNASIRAK